MHIQVYFKEDFHVHCHNLDLQVDGKKVQRDAAIPIFHFMFEKKKTCTVFLSS